MTRVQIDGGMRSTRPLSRTASGAVPAIMRGSQGRYILYISFDYLSPFRKEDTHRIDRRGGGPGWGSATGPNRAEHYTDGEVMTSLICHRLRWIGEGEN